LQQPKQEVKLIFTQLIFFLLIVSIPFGFYVSATLENRRIELAQELQTHAEKISQAIYTFSGGEERSFYFPRSLLYTAAIYDADDQAIFSLLTETSVHPFDAQYDRFGDQLCLQRLLYPNVFEARTLIVCGEIQHTGTVHNVLLMLIGIVSLMLLASFLIIRQSVQFYKRINAYLDEFIKDAIHELKTPLGVSLFNIDMLEMNHQNNKYIRRIKSALKNMSVIYEDLEFHAKAPTLSYTPTLINLSLFLKGRIGFFSDLAQAKQITVTEAIEPECFVMIHEIELQRIIDNTLSNAIKYSKEKTTILVSLEHHAHGITLRVQDQGVGIADVEKIFTRYYREERISGGFGIGLSIVKTICDRHGIFIHVDSTPKKGSTFTYTFPNP